MFTNMISLILSIHHMISLTAYFCHSVKSYSFFSRIIIAEIACTLSQDARIMSCI